MSGTSTWLGLQLSDELLVNVLSKFGDELVLAASATNDLLVASQVRPTLPRVTI